ncbi:PhzF family phenazine biosynthesis protein [Adlercreutzia sp. R25]|uniref:PhzF family phenazine biosynthesis protein n=1 Tax=Adlercreutzia shanghongiae TaxID=3111773 RepID=UPI002DBC4F5A|nr:PhzF family phenazine biosynthesis protein [Adlercreutzia sp. R25]MEC4273454.1 PhzF family phenazine biosynthesis protein [Adlercreutzia sp. R25]
MDFYIVDCFAEGTHQGNQLAVFFPDTPLSTDMMQAIAQEMHFSETTFVCSGDKGGHRFDVRIFTPDVEVPFAGHPTLGTAHLLREVNELGADATVYLDLKAGSIPVRGENGCLFMTQNQPEFGTLVDPSDIAAALSLEVGDIDDSLPLQLVSTGLEAIIVPLTSHDALRRCRVNFDALRHVHETYCKCNVLVFVPEPDALEARVFMDDTGFPEDPATGSANGCLAAYLLHYDVLGSHHLAYRVSQGADIGRPSTLQVRASLEQSRYAIEVGGRACTVAKGTWLAI